MTKEIRSELIVCDKTPRTFLNSSLTSLLEKLKSHLSGVDQTVQLVNELSFLIRERLPYRLID